MNYVKMAKDKYINAPLVNPKRLTMKQVNAAIQAVYPGVELVKGEGYFYIYGLSEEMGNKIASLYTSSIPVCKLNQQTLEAWVRDVGELLKDSYRNF